MIYQIKKIYSFKIKPVLKIKTQNFKIRKKKRKEIIVILIFKMLIRFKNKFKFHRIKESNKQAIDFQIYLLQVIQIKKIIHKKSKNILMMILKIQWIMNLNHNLKNMANKINKKIKQIS